MCENDRDCGYPGEGHYCGCEVHHRHHMGFGFPLISIEDEIKALERIKAVLEKRLEIVNKRLELLKR